MKRIISENESILIIAHQFIPEAVKYETLMRYRTHNGWRGPQCHRKLQRNAFFSSKTIFNQPNLIHSLKVQQRSTVHTSAQAQYFRDTFILKTYSQQHTSNTTLDKILPSLFRTTQSIDETVDARWIPGGFCGFSWVDSWHPSWIDKSSQEGVGSCFSRPLLRCFSNRAKRESLDGTKVPTKTFCPLRKSGIHSKIWVFAYKSSCRKRKRK